MTQNRPHTPLSPVAGARIRRAALLAPGTAVVVTDDRNALSREGTVTRNALACEADPKVTVLFKLPGSRSNVDYPPSDFERFDMRGA